ncbi:MAG: hypothetical protein V4490_03875, partial [Pseudomonadota bacterium]
ALRKRLVKEGHVLKSHALNTPPGGEVVVFQHKTRFPFRRSVDVFYIQGESKTNTLKPNETESDIESETSESQAKE